MIFLSHNYNRLLKLPDLLQKLEIHSHMRILETAVKYKDQKIFNFHVFINFIIQMLEKPNSREYSVFLSLFKVDDFNLDELEKLYKCKNLDKSFLKNEAERFISNFDETPQIIHVFAKKYVYFT